MRTPELAGPELAAPELTGPELTGAPAGRILSLRQKCALLALFVVLALGRLPRATWHGRFLGEEGTVFFAFAWHRPAWQALWRSFGGYLNLGANGPTLLAARLVQWGLVPLESAPRLTMAMALAVQTIPALLLLNGRAPWLRQRGAVVISVLIIALCPRVEETWLNVLHIQFHLTLCCGLILALDCPPRWRGRLGYGVILFLAPLCGPGAMALSPFFALRTLVDRSRGRLVQTLAIGAGCAVQLLFLTPSPVRGEMLDPLMLASILFVRLGALPMVGITLANGVGDGGFIAWRGQGLLWWGFGALACAFCVGLLGLAWRFRRSAGAWLIVAGLGLAVISYGGGMIVSNPKDWLNTGSAERYNFVPAVMIYIGVVAIALEMQGRMRRVATRTAIWFVMVGAASYVTPISILREGPVWSQEVAMWRHDHNYRLKGWPEQWPIDLSDRDRPCPAFVPRRASLNDPSYCETWWLAFVKAQVPHGRFRPS